MKTSTLRCLVLFSILGLTIASAVHAQNEVAVGSHGELYLAKSGTYSQLFPDTAPPRGVLAEDPVLALDVVRPGAPVERHLVPETAGEGVESNPYLRFEEASDTLFLIWESRINQIHPVLFLGGFSDDSWIDPIKILGNFVAAKTSPRIGITRDSYQVDGEEKPRSRTILHVFWEEDNGRGAFEASYLPLILENGAFIGRSQIFNLDRLDISGPANLQFEPSADLLRSIRVQPGRDDQTLVVSFASPGTERIVSLEVDVLPTQLSQVADDARIHIIDIGRKLSYPQKLQQIADGARIHIIDIGARWFEPEIAKAIGDAVRAKILERKGADPIDVLAGLARIHIIDIGAKLSGRGLRNLNGASQIAEIEVTPDPSFRVTLPANPTVHLLQFRVAASRPLPEVGAGPVTLFASKTGQDQLIAWAEKDRVKYRVSDGNGWSEAREILFTPGVDLQRAYEILDQRMDR